MKLPARHDDADARREQALTPMIDLVFLLLTFWICASVGRVSEQALPAPLSGTAVESDLAPPPADDPPPLGEVWVALSYDGTATAAAVNDVPRGDLGRLEAVLRGLSAAGAAGELPPVLDADGAVPAGDVVRAYDAAKAAGFQQVSFAAAPPGG